MSMYKTDNDDKKMRQLNSVISFEMIVFRKNSSL